MIDETRALVNGGDIYKEPRTYMGHSLDSDIASKVKDYYLNDDFNCSRQSANKSDIMSVNRHGMKCNIKEMYTLFIK